MHAVIVGGGIGGLAAAIALERIGADVTVLEQAPAVLGVGAGLSLWSNAMKALRMLGVEEQVARLGSAIERVRSVARTGRTVAEIVLPEAGAVSICVHRGALQSCLFEQVRASSVRTNARCIGFAGSTALLADGTRCEGDVVIGADGIDSVIREQLHGYSALRYAGYTCWRGMTHDPGALPAGSTLTAAGKGMQVGLFPCG